jgi:hypothetical protein
VTSRNRNERARQRAIAKRRRDYESHDRLLIKKGAAEGRERGKLEGKLELLEEQLSLPLTSTEQLEAMSDEELARRIESLESLWTSQPR